MMTISLRSAVLGAILFAIGCRSMPACPAKSAHLATHYYGDSGEFWFDGAIAYTSYHTSSIAPVEILTTPLGEYFADRLEMADEMCMGQDRLQAILARAPFMKISGRGHYTDEPRRFVIDCLCSAEPLPETPELRKRLEPIFPR